MLESYIRTAADRLALEQGCYFDQQQADRIITFVERFLNSPIYQDIQAITLATRMVKSTLRLEIARR